MKIEDDKTTGIETKPSVATNFQSSLAKFTFVPGPNSGIDLGIRKSSRKPVSRKRESSPGSEADPINSKARKFQAADDDPEGMEAPGVEPPQLAKRPPKKRKRGFAGPELYAHLHGLQDHVQEGLDGE